MSLGVLNERAITYDPVDPKPWRTYAHGVSELIPSNSMINLKGKTLFITGASRGIGKAIGLRAAGEGANIVIAAKTVEPHPKLPGTIQSAAEEMEAAGGRALACAVD